MILETTPAVRASEIPMGHGSLYSPVSELPSRNNLKALDPEIGHPEGM